MKIREIRWVFLALAFLPWLLFGTEPAGTPAPPSAFTDSTTNAVPHSERLADVQRKMARFGGKHFDLVFDGDSIMNRWETTGRAIWQQRYAARAADFGIEGDRVENLLWRVEQGQLNGVDPKVVILMIGTNNSGRNSAAEIAAGITHLVTEYEHRCPDAHIILMGIFPRGEKPTDGGRQKVAAVNMRIKGLDDGNRVTFLDIGSSLAGPNGIISREMMPDFVHPTSEGYQIWADAIQPIIDKYLSSHTDKAGD